MDLERTLRVGYGAAANALEMLRDSQVREETWQLLGANPNALVDLLEYKGRTVEAEARQWLAEAQAEVRANVSTARQEAVKQEAARQQTIDVKPIPDAADPVADLVETLRRLREGR